MEPGELEKLPARPADYRIKYGEAPSQFGDLRVPPEKGLHPVVVLIHGGCWEQRYASLRDLAAMGDALKAEGIASWNVEYRRIGEPGGGWPGTFLDVGAAIDKLRSLAKNYHLDLSRVVVLGHSAGGQLAHWSGGRSRLSPTSPVYAPHPLKPRSIINLAGRMDMSAGIEDYEKLCRDRVVHDLLGGSPASVPQRYHDASPIDLLPLHIPQVLIWGDHENFVPVPLLRSYVSAARRAGDHVEIISIPNAGHFEAASPQSAAWPHVLRAIEDALGRRR
jgi:acetyl esterase/lipase